MQGVKTGDLACMFAECKSRVKGRRFCDRCRRVMAEQTAATNRILFPPRQPYTPRVVTVLRDR